MDTINPNNINEYRIQRHFYILLETTCEKFDLVNIYNFFH